MHFDMIAEGASAFLDVLKSFLTNILNVFFNEQRPNKSN